MSPDLSNSQASSKNILILLNPVPLPASQIVKMHDPSQDTLEELPKLEVLPLVSGNLQFWIEPLDTPKIENARDRLSSQLPGLNRAKAKRPR